MADDSKTSNVGGRYAQALFDLASDENKIAVVEADLKSLKAMLAEHWRLPLDQQQALFERFLSDYQHGRVQRDDITLIGFRVREDRGRALQSSDRGALAAE